MDVVNAANTIKRRRYLKPCAQQTGVFILLNQNNGINPYFQTVLRSLRHQITQTESFISEGKQDLLYFRHIKS